MNRERDGRLIQVCMLDNASYPQIEMHRKVYSPAGVSPTIPTHSGGGERPAHHGGERMTGAEYIIFPTWPAYNILNRVYTGGGCSPTLTTQCAHSKPPLILVEAKGWHRNAPR